MPNRTGCCAGAEVVQRFDGWMYWHSCEPAVLKASCSSSCRPIASCTLDALYQPVKVSQRWTCGIDLPATKVSVLGSISVS